MNQQIRCPHCEEKLQAFTLPDAGGWDSEFHLACFNDDCSYYQRGWRWMENRYGVRSSYRFRLDPVSGQSSPIAVWSPDALKDRILDADISVEPVTDSNQAGDQGTPS